jgi:hypothetical protein
LRSGALATFDLAIFDKETKIKTQQTVIICVASFLSVVAIAVGYVVVEQDIAFDGARPTTEIGETVGPTPAEMLHPVRDALEFVPNFETRAEFAHFRPNNAWNLPKERGRVISARVASHSNSYEPRSAALRQFQNTLAGLRLAQDVVLNNIANAGTTGFKRS